MRQVNKLDADEIASLSKPGLYGDGLGLWLQVRKTKGGLSRSWIFRYRTGAKSCYMGLGAFPLVSLGAARKKANTARQALGGNGIEGRVDLIAIKQAARAAAAAEAGNVTTFTQAAERYIKAHADTWKNPKHAAQWPATLEKFVYPIFGEVSVAAVNVGLVLKSIEPIWSEKPETASRVRGRIEAFLDWASARGLRSADNPARWKGHLDKLLPAKTKVRAVEHHAALPYQVINAFIADLRQREGLAARALELAILTGARTGEVIGARWTEIDLGTAVWTIPAERMKAGKEHKVPLSSAALAVLHPLHTGRLSDASFVFAVAKDKPLSSMGMLMLLRRMDHGNITVHGFRSSFRDWASERTNFSREVVEMSLAHAIGDKVEAAYRRGDLFAKRKQLLEAWARYCALPVANAGGNVRDLGAVRAK